jgi:hypothetical protein
VDINKVTDRVEHLKEVFFFIGASAIEGVVAFGEPIRCGSGKNTAVS